MISPVPSFAISKENSISLTIPNTDATLADQGYTYNEAGLTYNQVGIEYGGVVNVNTDVTPMLFAGDLEKKISLTIPSTQATFYDQGYAYNQANFTYNQLGIAYGGISQQNQDILPVLLDAKLIYPSISIITDLYTPPPTPNNYHSVGPGWFMFITTTS